MYDFAALRDAVLTGNAPAAVAAARQAIDAGVDPVVLTNDGISPAMAEVGRLYEAGEYFVPELLLAARATKEVFGIIRPLLVKKGAEPTGRVVLGTVQGDLHDIGKNLVAAMLEGSGFEVIDLGVNVPTEKFIATINEKKPHIVGLSALLTTTMPAMKTAIEGFRAAGVRDRVKVMIGGAPVTQSYADAIGADAFGENAANAVDVARHLVGR
jgi:5-methyltetrahydrofolate--homocysteine methyltransferase